MASWSKVSVVSESGEEQQAIAPYIISASRATDIPAFYGEWFLRRLQEGYSVWRNPFNGAKQYISYENARAFIFWTKNISPFLPSIETLLEQGKQFYVLHSLNDYDKEQYERNIPPLRVRTEAFIQLSKRIGKEKVIWRFDPLLLSCKVSLDMLFERIEALGNVLVHHTDKLIFSFVEIDKYRKVQHSLSRYIADIREFTHNEKECMAQFLQQCLHHWRQQNPGFSIAICGQTNHWTQYSIESAKCVDDELLQRLFPHDEVLQAYLEKHKTSKDKGQRAACRCFMSKDIGSYNTCPHECLYCYANTSISTAHKRLTLHNASNEEI